jgi:hypothetical protein
MLRFIWWKKYRLKLSLWAFLWQSYDNIGAIIASYCYRVENVTKYMAMFFLDEKDSSIDVVYSRGASFSVNKWSGAPPPILLHFPLSLIDILRWG